LSFLSRRSRDEIDLVHGREVMIRRPIPPAIRAATEKGIAIEQGRAMVQAARIRGYERVASEGMHAIGSISRDEAFYSRHVPHAAARLQAVADLFAMGVADMVAEAGRE
jgi:hypothetical protein